MVFSRKTKLLLLFVPLVTVLILVYLYESKAQNNKRESILRFRVVNEELTSKYSLVRIGATSSDDATIVLAAFDVYADEKVKRLHTNNFWNPESCAKMPSLFVKNNFLVVLDAKKENENYVTRIFNYDYISNMLFESEQLEGVIGALYKDSQDDLIFFTSSNGSITKNELNISNGKILTTVIYTLLDKKSSVKVSQLEDDFYFKIYSVEGVKSLKLTRDILSEVDSTEEIDFWYVDNNSQKVSVYKKSGETFNFPKNSFETYRLLKSSNKKLLFEVVNNSNFYDYTIKVFDLRTKRITDFYSNKGIQNSHYIISIN